MSMPAPIEVFYCYADSDLPLLEQLKNHLSTLQQQGLISTWDKRQIVAGADWQEERDRHLNTASLILLLISPDFLASYLYREELQRAIKRHEDKEACVIPILLRSCDCESALFKKLQMVPRNGTPLTLWSNLDAGFTEIVKEIRLALQSLTSLLFSTPASKRPLWNVPYRRNRYFTGREELLKKLDQQLSSEVQEHGTVMHRAALTQPQAISGLGGIGKTQIAIEYAYRSRDRGHYTHTFWVNADSEETIVESFVSIANLLPPLAVYEEMDQHKIVKEVKCWLEHCEQRWLLIFDNADKVTRVCDYLPQAGNGSILLTTRDHAVGSLATSVEVEEMGHYEGTQLLLHRAQRFKHASDEEINQAGNIVVALGYFPLALDQAGAYIEETGCSLTDYLAAYQKHPSALLARRGKQAVNYHASVATTWSLSFHKVQKDDPAAAELLYLCCFLMPKRIPEELLKDGAGDHTFNKKIEVLLNFSLLKRSAEEHTLSIHPLVQAVLKDTMDTQKKQLWAEQAVRAVRAIMAISPPAETVQWLHWERIMPNALLCAQYIRGYNMRFTEATDLLSETGLHLARRAQYNKAKKLYRDCLDILEESQHSNSLLSKAFVLINLGNVYSETGMYDKAKECYEKSLCIFEPNKELDRHEFARLLNDRAILFKVRGEPKYAEAWYIRSLNILIQSFVTSGEVPGKPAKAKKKQPTPDDLDIETLSKVLSKSKEEIHWYIRRLLSEKTAVRKFAQVLNNLAVLYAEQLHKYGTAERLFYLSLWLQEQDLGHDTPDYALSCNNLANLYIVRGSNPGVQPDGRRTLYEQAQSLYRKSENILKEWHNGVGHIGIAYPLLGQGILHFKQGKDEDAEACYKTSLSIWENLRRYHPQIGYACYNLANLYFEQDDYEEAKRWYKTSLDIWEDRLSPHHLHTCTCKKIYTLLSHNPKGETDVQKAELVVLPTYRSFRL